MHRRVSKDRTGRGDDIGVRISPQVPAANRPVQQLAGWCCHPYLQEAPGLTVATLQETAGPAYALRFAPRFQDAMP